MPASARTTTSSAATWPSPRRTQRCAKSISTAGARGEALVERADELEGVAAQVDAGAERAGESRAQAQRLLEQASGDVVEQAEGITVAGEGERAAGQRERARGGEVRVGVGGVAELVEPAVGDVAGSEQQRDVGGGEQVQRGVERARPCVRRAARRYLIVVGTRIGIPTTMTPVSAA